MIDEPVQKRSASSMKPKLWLIQITSSSLRRETCSIARLAADVNSIAKSRSLTASMLFWHTPSMRSALATASRSSGKLVPASAAAPSGSRFVRARTSAMRSASRANIST